MGGPLVKPDSAGDKFALFPGSGLFLSPGGARIWLAAKRATGEIRRAVQPIFGGEAMQEYQVWK